MNGLFNSSSNTSSWIDAIALREPYLLQYWQENGFFTLDFIKEINPHWLQFDPAKPSSHFFLAFLYLVISVVGILSNGAVIYFLLSRRNLRTPGNYLIINLAFSDIIMLMKIPLFVYNSFLRGPALGRIGCQVYGFVGGLTGTTSIMTLAAIAFDRYSVISSPLDLKRKTSRIKALSLVLSTWVYAGIFSSLPLLGVGKYTPEGYLTSCSFDYFDTSTENLIFISAFFIAAWLVPLSIITCCYTAIVRAVIKTQRGFPAPESPRQATTRNKNPSIESRNLEIVISKMILGLVGLWFVAWTPYAAVALTAITGHGKHITPCLSMIPALFCKTAACIDPFFYALSHPKIKMEILLIIRNAFTANSHESFSEAARNTIYNRSQIASARRSTEL